MTTKEKDTVWCVELYEGNELENIFCFQDEKLAIGFHSYLRRHQCKARLVISNFDKLMRKHGRVILSYRKTSNKEIAILSRSFKLMAKEIKAKIDAITVEKNEREFK